jgi:hypothetical protein
MIFGSGGKTAFIRHGAQLFPATVFRLRMMGRRLTAISLATLIVALALAGAAGAALVGIYRDGMQTKAQREQMVKVHGERCGRGALGQALRVVIGKRTRECAFRTPVIGRNLEIAATERLLGSTPAPAQHRAFLAVSLRGEGGVAGYQLAVYPAQRKVQLRKILADGRVKYLDIVREVSTVKGVEGANELRLRAFDLGGGSCQVLAFVGGKLVAEANDEAAAELKGRLSGFSVGAASGARGIAASVDDVVVRVPSPFG